ncbi:MAG: tyrosine-type recombinase/integrase [Bryobacteraceae bacterium]
MPRQRFQNPKIQQSKNGSYFIRPRVDVVTAEGLVRRKETIVLGMSKRAAVAKKNEVMGVVNQAQYMIQSQISFGEMLDNFQRAHASKLGYVAQSKYANLIKNHIQPAFGNLSMYEITTQRIQSWLDRKGEAGFSWSTRTDLRNLLSGVFSRATEWGLYKEPNPVRFVHAGRRALVLEKRKLDIDQTRRLLASLPPDLRVMCCTCLFCTLRVTEALGLQEKHLDFERNVILIRQRFFRGDLDKRTKSARSCRDVPMGYLGFDLKQLCTGDPERFVFQIKTRPKWGRQQGICRDDRDLTQHFLRPIAKELGFYWKGFGFRSLRREAITAIGSEAGIGQAMNAAGHAHADTSLLYTLQDLSEQDRAIRTHQERILGKPEGGLQ